MALHECRVFRDGDDFWVAQVIAASGTGVGPVQPRMEHERVVCRRLGSEGGTLVFGLAADWLNRMDHASIVALARRAEPFDYSGDLHPHGQEDIEQYTPDQLVEDEEGLRWAVVNGCSVVVTDEGQPEIRRALKFVCLDDSALRVRVPLAGVAQSAHEVPDHIKREVINFIKTEVFLPYDSEEHPEEER